MSLSISIDTRSTGSATSLKNYHSSIPFHTGLTLLELVVVLAILGLLASIAVRSLDPIANQSRYDQTRIALNELRVATVGDCHAKLTSGQRLIGGYLADTGLLPTSIDDLLEPPVSLISYSLQSFDSDRDTINDISISSGWKGPYLHLGAGQTDWIDGWGNAFTLSESAGTLEYRSLGSDGDSIGIEDDYQADLVEPILPGEYQSTLVLRIFGIETTGGSRVDPSNAWLLTLGAYTGTPRIGLLYYGINANGGTTGAIQETLLVVPTNGTFDYRLDVIHGAAAARAIAWDDVNNDQQLDSGESILGKSYVQNIQVIAGPDIRIEFELR